MPDASDIADAIAENADTGIKSVTVDGNTTTKISVDEQIKAAQYAAGQATASAAPGHFGLRFSQLVPPGCG